MSRTQRPWSNPPSRSNFNASTSARHQLSLRQIATLIITLSQRRFLFFYKNFSKSILWYQLYFVSGYYI
uniref:Uncharacterized protein n=1 Tax=Manihot esculenta TaxID=3983 RepID=A0A2C9WEW4_MANES